MDQLRKVEIRLPSCLDNKTYQVEEPHRSRSHAGNARDVKSISFHPCGGDGDGDGDDEAAGYF